MSTATRQATHGTQYRYRVLYRPDAAAPRMSWSCWAYDKEDALERFLWGPDGFEERDVERIERW